MTSTLPSLGTPRRRFGASRFAFVASLYIGIPGLALGLALGLILVVVSSTTGRGSSAPPVAVFLADGMLLAGSLFLIAKALSSRGRSFLLFDDALVQVNYGETCVFRWDEITAIYESITPNQIANGGPPFWVSFRIERDDGREASIGFWVDDARDLLNIVHAKVTNERLRPLLVEQFDYGAEVEFGILAVGRQALTFDGRRVKWEDFGGDFSLWIRTRRGRAVPHHCLTDASWRPHAWDSHVLLDRVPNIRLFYELVDRASPGYWPTHDCWRLMRGGTSTIVEDE